MNTDDYAEMHGRLRATEKARDTYAAQAGATLGKLHAAQQRIAELEAERDDYRERWEQTGCTRHSAMETAIKLAESYRKQLDDIAAERDRLIDELRDAEARNAQKLAEIARLREALSWYYEEVYALYRNTESSKLGAIDAGIKVLLLDKGSRARAGLESGDE